MELSAKEEKKEDTKCGEVCYDKGSDSRCVFADDLDGLDAAFSHCLQSPSWLSVEWIFTF